MLLDLSNQDPFFDRIVKARFMIRERGPSNWEIKKFFSAINLDDILAPGMKVLELGCGNGRTLAGLAEEYGIIPYGTDLADFISSDTGKSIFFETGNIQTQIPWDDGTFDFIYSYKTFMFMPDKLSGLRECHRVMKLHSTAYIDMSGDEPKERLIYPSFQVLLKQLPNGGQIKPIYYNFPNGRHLAIMITKTDTSPLIFPDLIKAELDGSNIVPISHYRERIH